MILSGIDHSLAKNFLHRITIVICLISCWVAPSTAQWSRMGQPYGGQVNCMIAIDDTLLAASNGAGLYRSVDDGAHWLPASNGLATPWIYSLMLNGDELFAGGLQTVFRSTDRGASWKQMAALPLNAYIHAFAMVRDTLYAAADTLAVFRSFDHGASWEYANSGLDHGAAAFAVVGDAIFLAGQSVRRWNPDLGEWDPMMNGLTGGAFNAICASGDTLYAGGAGGVFTSVDHGTTWSHVYGLSVSIRYLSVSGEHIFAASDSEIYELWRLGTLWKATIGGDEKYFGVLARDTSAFACSFNAGIVRSSLRVPMLVDANLGIANVPMTHLTSLGERLLLTTWRNDPVLRSDDHGVSWQESSNQLPRGRVSGFWHDDTLLCAAASSGALYRTTDGSVWTQVYYDSGFVLAYAHGGGRMFIAEQYLLQGLIWGVNVFRSTNDGARWVSIDNGENWGVTAFAFAGDVLLAAVGSSVFRSTNYGTNWTEHKALASGDAVGGFAVIGDTVYASSQKNRIVRTVDAGESWIVSDSGLPGNVASIMAHGSVLFAAVNDHGVYVKPAAGMPMHAVNDGLGDPGVIELTVAGEYLYALTPSGVWRRPLDEVLSDVAIDAQQRVPSASTLSQNFPNPCVASTTFNFSLPNSSRVQLDVVDALGNVMPVIAGETFGTGEHRVRWNASQLQAGVYVYRLRTGTSVLSGTMAVLR